MRIEIGDPLLAFLRYTQIPECITDIGADGLPKESRVGCPQIIGCLILELLARAGFPKFGKQRGRLAQAPRQGLIVVLTESAELLSNNRWMFRY